ncbi:MAG TPA: tetratricopeptide repeat protein [Methylomirabilota bacterium]|nr:tetratricopeptide repeat protein [Methylomirabilota bacterium]
MNLAFAVIVIAIPCLIFVLLPYARRGNVVVIHEEHPLAALQDEKARIYRAIKEISFEHQAGHLSQEDYQELRGRYEADAARLVTKIDAVGETAPRQAGRAFTRAHEASPQRLPWSRRPLTLVFGSVLLVIFGLTLGLGVARYTAPDPAAMPRPTPLTLESPSDAPPPGASGGSGGQRVITPEMLQGMLRAAHQSLDEGRYQEAIAAYKAVLKRNPKNVEAIAHLGIILGLAGHTDNAIEALDKAIGIDPNYAHAYWDKARLLSEQKQDLKGAVKAWEKFTQLAPPGADRDQALRMIQDAKGRLK